MMFITTDTIAQLRRLTSYPKLVSAVFPGLPDNLDTAFKWYNDGKSYLFNGIDSYI